MTSLFSLLLAMAGFSLVGAITPGPVNVLALRHGSQARRRVALGFVLGASASYAAVVWCMGQGAQWPQYMQWPCQLIFWNEARAAA